MAFDIDTNLADTDSGNIYVFSAVIEDCPAWNYLVTHRKLTPEVVRQCNFRYIPATEGKKASLLVPIKDARAKLTGIHFV